MITPWHYVIFSAVVLAAIPKKKASSWNIVALLLFLAWIFWALK